MAMKSSRIKSSQNQYEKLNKVHFLYEQLYLFKGTFNCSAVITVPPWMWEKSENMKFLK